MAELFERVSVINRNDFEIRDRCDGVAYWFPPGQRTVIPTDVARHLFLWPADEAEMHAHMARRWGWNRPEHYKLDDKGVPLWLKLCRKITVLVEKYELRRTKDPDAPIPAESAGDAPDMMELADDRPPARRGSVGRRRPRPAKRKLTPRVPTPARIDMLARPQPEPMPAPGPTEVSTAE